MDIATGLISSLFNVALSRDVRFHLSQQLQCLHHGSTKAKFVLLWAPFLSSLLCRWQFAVHTLWFWCETRVSAEQTGALIMLYFSKNVAQHVQRARSNTKHSDVPWSSNTPTFKSMNEVRASTIGHYVFSTMALLMMHN